MPVHVAPVSADRPSWLERLVLPGGTEVNWRAQYVVRIWGFGFIIAAPFLVAAVAEQRWWIALLLGSTVVGGAGVLASVRRSKGRVVQWPARLSLILVCVVFTLLGPLQSPPQLIAPVYLVLVPLVASFVFSWAETRRWLYLVLVVGAVAELAMAAGVYVHDTPRRFPGVMLAGTYVGLVLVIVFFARWFERAREHAVAELEAALRARTTFMANVSHEIRTPMNGVLGLTELLLGTPLSDAQREQLELIRQSGQGLVLLVDDLLDLARLERVGLELAPEPTDVEQVVRSVGQLFTPLARGRGLTLAVEVPPLSPRQVDGLRLRQVLSNLVSNAVKFTEAGTVVLEVTTDGPALTFTVRDTGIGMSPEVLGRLFRPFEQADASRSRRVAGSGLGLALSRGLVELMGGTLSVSSAVGEGSRFTFTIAPPVADAPVVAGTALVPSPAGMPRPLPVLVVDDNPVNLRVARGLVERAGFSTRCAASGEEAVAIARAEGLALVLMDCHMPGMDGLEATRTIRSALGDAAPRVVALTASAQPEDVRACLEAGMAAVLTKPVSYVKLLEVLEGVEAPSPAEGTGGLMPGGSASPPGGPPAPRPTGA